MTMNDNDMDATRRLLADATDSQLICVIGQILGLVGERGGSIEEVIGKAGTIALIRGCSARELAMKAKSIQRECYREAIFTVIEDCHEYVIDNEGRVREDDFTEHMEQTVDACEWTFNSNLTGITLAVSDNTEQYEVHFGSGGEQGYRAAAGMRQDVRDELLEFPEQHGLCKDGDFWEVIDYLPTAEVEQTCASGDEHEARCPCCGALVVVFTADLNEEMDCPSCERIIRVGIIRGGPRPMPLLQVDGGRSPR